MNLNPITREEKFLAKAGGEDVGELKPITREEKFLAKAGGEDVGELKPITRKEKFLDRLAGGGGGGDAQAVIDALVDSSITEFTTTANNIGYFALRSRQYLTNINMPNVTSIYDNAFDSCVKLALTSLPSGLTKIGSQAFSYCGKLALTSIPSSVTEIGSYAFRNCTALTELTFKGTPKSISSNAFYSCDNLKIINVPWAEGAVSGAPWRATNATINYNYTGA